MGAGNNILKIKVCENEIKLLRSLIYIKNAEVVDWPKKGIILFIIAEFVPAVNSY